MSTLEYHPAPTAAPPPKPSHDPFAGLSLRGGEGAGGFEDDGDTDDDEAPPARRRGAAGRSSGGRQNDDSRDTFQPGAIVRVKLENFVTYEKAEFFLGPNLNMVIGPNGTGKSSLVCAICLGLGYPSSVLGRASAFGDFVKHGKEEAVIEIELQKKPEDENNYIVGLCIKKEDNNRKFAINNVRATHKDVQNLMKSLRIQIDNLCQFLPQDKVAEFAGLSPVELLEKTLNAAAPAEMLEWQAELKESYKRQVEAKRLAGASSEHLRILQARQQALQADVEKLQERERITKKLEEQRILLLFVRYHKARLEHREAKRNHKDAQKRLKQLQTNSAPSLMAVNYKQDYQTQVQAVAEYRKEKVAEAEAAADQAAGLVDAAEAKCQELATKIDAEEKGSTTKRQALGGMRRAITELEARYASKPRDFDAAEWNQKIRAREHDKREVSNEIDDLNRELQKVMREGHDKKEEKTGLQNKLENLASKEGQLLSQLEAFNKDAATGWKWLQEHQDEFEKPVFGPAAVTCSVKDPRYSDIIQSLMGKSDFMCFTAQTLKDHKKLSAALYDELKLGEVTIRSCYQPLSHFRAPHSQQELAELGFEGYAIDLIEGPDPVRAMLCSDSKLHTALIALRPLADDKIDIVIRDNRVSKFSCGNLNYRVRRRAEYGPDACSTSIIQIRPGKYWKGDVVDPTAKLELEKQIEQMEQELAAIKERYKEMKSKLGGLEEKDKAFAEEINQIRKQKAELQKEYSVWQALPDKIATQKATLQAKEGEVMATRARIKDIRRKQGAARVDKAKAVLQHHAKVGAIRGAYQAMLEAQLLLLEAKSDVAYLKEKNVEIKQQLDVEGKKIEELAQEVAATKAVAYGFLREVQNLTLDEEEQKEYAERAATLSQEAIEVEILAEEAKLKLITANNENALREYESWTAKIQKETADHETQEARVKALEDKIARVRGQWEPRLDELVERINNAFSHNFEQISCAGEVGVHKDEDFEKWAIEIRVKFRENETLQQLDQHRQSGGERAVSTIFYLMSLQSMAQAPFRVVDEINQGMDPRNERMVHERMVDIACREYTSQYFLITPKLLSGLRYDERMKVHTIVSGEHVDSQGTVKMNFSKFAKIQRGIMGRG